ncbi:hypothetical protein NPX13_g2880 [Xylaria arbuscula]|uniref:Chitinase n=1 Tax=Xylaria arbuscula TaxID=114810 RepID=A0A9W8TNR6_9PEZI|nr:hypothetical protein NPX13_g2880 [Xylaria arbuscula]
MERTENYKDREKEERAFALGSQAASCQPQTRRVVQYYGKQVDDHGTKFHIDLLVNNPDNKTYATNVLMGEFDLHENKTLGLNGGIKVSLWLRQGFEFLKKDNKDFETYYAALNKTIMDYNFEGIDLDIEDGQSGCPESAMTLEDTVHLVQRLRDDFSPKFIITLAPVSDALLDEGNVSCFDYQDLEKRAAANINWYNAQFYGGSWQGLKTPAYYERCIKEGKWDPKRIVTAITTSSDFTYPLPRSSWIGLNETGPTIETLVKKYTDFGGVGGFEFYDAEPGGYGAPWQWSRWAARRMSVRFLFC